LIGFKHSRASLESKFAHALSLLSCSRGDNGIALQIQHDGQFAQGRHAQIARRVIVSQACALVPSGKSDALLRPSRAHHEGRFAVVTKRGAGCDGRGCIN
jgi:hypothetical protein